MNDPLFIDECLTLALVAKATSRGHIATHVVFMGMTGKKDWDILPMLLEENYVLVTNNGEEFKRRYAKLDVHPGLIIIVPGGILKERQVELFDCVLDVMEKMDDLVNKVLSVDNDGKVDISDLPSPDKNISKPGIGR